jgi:hypothetical protein
MRPPPDGSADHETSIAVWDLTSPMVVGRPATLKVGISCSSGCDLSGARVDIYNHAGARVGDGIVGSQPWPATTALYWAELDVAAPEIEGDQSWNIHATTAEPKHADATSSVRFVAGKPPEHRVTLEVIDKNSGVPVPDVELRLGAFRAATDGGGIARIEVPGGAYEIGGWKLGYELISQTVHIGGDTTIHLELAATPETEQPYWM